MRTIFVASIAMLLTGSVAVGARSALAAPHLDSSSPSKCATHGSHGVSLQSLGLKGTGLAGPSTNGYTWPRDVQLYVSENRAPFQQIAPGWSAERMISGWSAESLSVAYRSTAMCTSPGELQFRVTVLGVSSNVLHIPIVAPPSGPPTVLSFSPARMPITAASPLLSVYGTNFDSDTTLVTIDGITCAVGNGSYPDGYLRVWVPASVKSKPGRHVLAVTSERGSSSPMNFDVVGAPVITSVEPAVVNLAPTSAKPRTMVRNTANGNLALPQPGASESANSAAMHPIIVQTPPGVRNATARIALGSQFIVKARDIDDAVALEFEGERLPLTTKVLAYGRQAVGASLPDWAATRCGHRTYSIQLVTAVGASTKAILETDGGACATPPPPGSLHTAPPR